MTNKLELTPSKHLQIEAWKVYLRNGRLTAIAAFLKHDGEINQKVLSDLIKILRTRVKQNSFSQKDDESENKLISHRVENLKNKARSKLFVRIGSKLKERFSLGESKFEEIIPEKNDNILGNDRYENHLNDIQEDNWQEFLMTGNPKALAEYLDNGGNIDEQIRKILILILLKKPYLDSKGNKNRWRDFSVYCDINQIKSGYNVSTQRACLLYAEAVQTEREEELGTLDTVLARIKRQNKRGKEIFNSNTKL
ncbi:MAG: hypothetical protein OCD03_11250 [Hyphomicrobiales bacterium]